MSSQLPVMDPSTTPSLRTAPLPATASLDESWAFLSQGIDYIFAYQSIPISSSMALYTTLFNYLTSPKILPPGARPDVSRTGANLMGSDIYTRLDKHFKADFYKSLRKKVEPLHGEELLRCYASEWEIYRKAAKKLDNIFNFLDLHWISRERQEGRRTIYPVKKLLYRAWREHLLLPIQNEERKLSVALINQLERQRAEETVDIALMKDIVTSLIEVGVKEGKTIEIPRHSPALPPKDDINEECLDVYKEIFEASLFEISEKYYKESSERLRSKAESNEDYLQKTRVRVEEEENYITSHLEYIHADTKKELSRRCSNILFGE